MQRPVRVGSRLIVWTASATQVDPRRWSELESAEPNLTDLSPTVFSPLARASFHLSVTPLVVNTPPGPVFLLPLALLI